MLVAHGENLFTMLRGGRHRYTDAEIKGILKSTIVLTDTREQANQHILTALDEMGVTHRPMALSFGDYSVMLPSQPDAGITMDTYFDGEIIIERKNSLDELASNFTAGRDRFKSEWLRSGSARKYLLVEDSSGYGGILAHQYRNNFSEKAFLASLLSFQSRYGLNVIFCDAAQAGCIVWSLLYYHVRFCLLG